MTIDDFRRVALMMPDAVESSHMGHPDFRVGGKIFATLWPAENRGMVKLTPEQQHEFCKMQPSIFVPVKGGWGLKGCTNVRLEAADEATARTALQVAWRNTTAKKSSARKPAKYTPARPKR